MVIYLTQNGQRTSIEIKIYQLSREFVDIQALGFVLDDFMNAEV
jgi:hypothetical protein